MKETILLENQIHSPTYNEGAEFVLYFECGDHKSFLSLENYTLSSIVHEYPNIFRALKCFCGTKAR